MVPVRAEMVGNRIPNSLHEGRRIPNDFNQQFFLAAILSERDLKLNGPWI